jgi:hypothetical protein
METNDFLTAATANRLKLAGFPQPRPRAGQFWYNSTGALFVILKVTINGAMFAYLSGPKAGEPGMRGTDFGAQVLTYCPTAPEILSKLYSASLHKIAFLHGGGYMVYFRDPKNYGSVTKI